MGQPIPAQHPSVVLRSHFKLVRGLLAIAMVAVLALTATVVILANDDDQVSPATKAAPVTQSQPQTPAGIRYDGGPEEGTRGAISTPQVAPAGTRYDGGPEEGTRGAISTPQVAPAGSRYDGGPEEGTRGPEQFQSKERAGGPTIIPQGPLSR
jgi:hypothetical protein